MKRTEIRTQSACNDYIIYSSFKQQQKKYMVQTQIYTIHIAISFEKCDPNVLALNVAVDNPKEPFILMLMFVCSHSIAQRKRIKWSSTLSRCQNSQLLKNKTNKQPNRRDIFSMGIKALYPLFAMLFRKLFSWLRSIALSLQRNSEADCK